MLIETIRNGLAIVSSVVE
ncbi:hypothetical protein Goari_020196, partial [Gossypium aridum]|nr:hypothetical protein [Gossypium aridum]